MISQIIFLFNQNRYMVKGVFSTQQINSISLVSSKIFAATRDIRRRNSKNMHDKLIMHAGKKY